jgi:hypothetical protein
MRSALYAFMYRGRAVMLVVEDGLAGIRTDTGWVFMPAVRR